MRTTIEVEHLDKNEKSFFLTDILKLDKDNCLEKLEKYLFNLENYSLADVLLEIITTQKLTGSEKILCFLFLGSSITEITKSRNDVYDISTKIH